jgi:hypothetical protein
VAKFAASAKSASTGFSGIASDFAGSAKRRAAYVSEEERPKVLNAAKAYKAQEADMLAAQKILVAYVAALAAISTDSATSRDTSITSITNGSLVEAGVTASEATAGAGLAKSVTDALSAGYRSNKAGKVIHDCNPQLQEYLKGLEHIVGTDYAGVLNSEQISAEGYYNDLLRKYGEKEPLAAVEIIRQKQQDLDAIAKKQTAAAAYVKVLTDIGEGHQKLYDAGQNMGTKHMLTILQPYMEDIAVQSANVAAAY